MPDKRVTVMGSFVADLAFRASTMPVWGQTIMGSEFRLGPGGKGSNQAVAAARLGGRVSFITKLGNDPFGDLARQTYKEEGIDSRFCFNTSEFATGAASIIVHEVRGENGIVVVPGAGFHLTTADVDRATPLIAESSMFITQLEIPIPVAEYGLQVAHRLGVTTVLNPAPASVLPNSIYQYCDYLTPNESEAAALTGITVTDLATAERAADVMLGRGARNVIITLGEKGAFIKNSLVNELVPAFDAGPVVETTGAGDSFNGALVIALSEGLDLLAAVKFGCAAAGISVTRPGTAPAMPRRSELDAVLRLP